MRDICDHCDQRRTITYAGPLPPQFPLGWGKFCEPCRVAQGLPMTPQTAAAWGRLYRAHVAAERAGMPFTEARLRALEQFNQTEKELAEEATPSGDMGCGGA